MSNAPHQTIVVQQAGTSGLAIAGLVFSIFGWFTCGTLCILGAALSFLGLFARGPKGTAVAGLIVGFPGVLFFLFFGLAFIMGILGLGAAATSVATGDHAQTMPVESSPVESAEEPATSPPDEDAHAESGVRAAEEPQQPVEAEPPEAEPSPAETPANATDPDGDKKSEPEPAADPNRRTWTDATGAFRIDATFVSYANGQVKLQKLDGAIITVPLDRLSEDDQSFVRKKFR